MYSPTIKAGQRTAGAAHQGQERQGDDDDLHGPSRAGRIGRIHGRNAAATRMRASSRWPTRTRQPRRSWPPPRAPRSRPSTRSSSARRRRRPDLHADHHPCRSDRARRARRQGGVLRKAGRPLEPAHQACLAIVEKAGTPLMIGFNRRFDPEFRQPAPPPRRRRGRRGRTRDDHVARSRPAAGQLHRHAQAACSAT